MEAGERTQPEFSEGERLARLEALYEAFLRSEAVWQEQIDGRVASLKEEAAAHRDERRNELNSVRTELAAQLSSTDKAISKAEQAQDKQNELTREDAQRARASIEQRVLALERGESTTSGVSQGAQQLKAAQIAAAGIAVTFGILIVGLLSFVVAHT